jgi:predicted nucleic acid-binding protein
VARPDRPEVVYFDASTLIAVITGEPAMAPLAQVLDKIEQGAVRLVASTALLVEVRRQAPGDQEARDAIRQLLLNDTYTRLVDVDLNVARRAEEYAAARQLKTWDAIHLATAVIGGASVMFIRDSKFRVGDTIEGVFISGPWNLEPEDLFNPGPL